MELLEDRTDQSLSEELFPWLHCASLPQGADAQTQTDEEGQYAIISIAEFDSLFERLDALLLSVRHFLAGVAA